MSEPLDGPGSYHHEAQLAGEQTQRHRFYCGECRQGPGWCPIGSVWADAHDALNKLYHEAKVDA